MDNNQCLEWISKYSWTHPHELYHLFSWPLICNKHIITGTQDKLLLLLKMLTFNLYGGRCDEFCTRRQQNLDGSRLHWETSTNRESFPGKVGHPSKGELELASWKKFKQWDYGNKISTIHLSFELHELSCFWKSPQLWQRMIVLVDLRLLFSAIPICFHKVRWATIMYIDRAHQLLSMCLR